MGWMRTADWTAPFWGVKPQRLLSRMTFGRVLVKRVEIPQPQIRKKLTTSFVLLAIIEIFLIVVIILFVSFLLSTLELNESAWWKGQFALYNSLVLGHTKQKGVQRVRCFTAVTNLGIDNGGFVPRRILSRMLGFSSCSQPQHKPTQGPRRLVDPSVNAEKLRLSWEC
jgi:hypothetical protein